jgi:NO-binding membrane sensor protein with MHYT domain
MLRIISLLLELRASLAGLVVANRALGLLQIFLAALIIGFAVAAAAWTVRRNV